jgi:hypothetical protein
MSSTNPVTFMITIPHATCVKTDLETGRHTCDILAPVAADWLMAALAARGAAVFDMPGNTNRGVEPDLNRRASRGSRYRKDVSEATTSSERPIFVIDVHSFDEKARWGVTEAGKVPTIVLLDGQQRPSATDAIPERLKDILTPGYQEYVQVGGSPENDIVVAAKEDGAIGAVLIEFSEAEFDTDEKLMDVSAELANALMMLARNM